MNQRKLIVSPWSNFAFAVAEKICVTRQTILRLEQSDGVPASKTQTMLALQKVFEEGGVEFIGSPEDRPGVRMV